MSKAVVVGATGAVGEHVVGWLLTIGAWQKVVTVGRRPMTVPAEYSPDMFKATLEQVTVNMDNLATEAEPAFQGAHSVFCCLGTTRKTAGSAEEFIKVDYQYVKAAAEAAKKAGVMHFSLLTAQGSNANVWANNWGMFHSLLYMRTKGQAEEAVKAQGFKAVSVFRPGLIGRGDKARGMEKALLKLKASHIPASGLAKLMVQDAEAHLGPEGLSQPPLRVFGMSELQKALREGRLPKGDSNSSPAAATASAHAAASPEEPK